MSPLNRWISIAKLNDHCDPQIGWRRSEMKKSLRNENELPHFIGSNCNRSLSSFYKLNDKLRSDTIRGENISFSLLNFKNLQLSVMKKNYNGAL